MKRFETVRQGLNESRIVDHPVAEADLLDGEILVKVDCFGYSANNITYGVAGDTLGYWQFFPADDEPEKWGAIPVWGFGDVTASKSDEIAIGERLFGYFPPAHACKMQPVGVKPGIFFEGAAHRAQLPRAYNSYTRVSNEAGYDKRFDKARMLLFPLYITAFALWDQLKENDWYGAEQIVLLSASSKTALGLALALQDDDTAPDCIGLTSPGNLSFVKDSAAYADAHAYDDAASLPDKATAIVDMSGNADLLGALHQQLGENMRHTLSVGLTHHESERRSKDVIRDRTEFFFAPSRIQKRMKDWGPAEFSEKSISFVMGAAAKSNDWLTYETLDGLEALQKIFPEIRDGTIAPDRGLIVKM